MGKLRFLFALWMAKLSIPALKITHHNGTDFPGSLAVRLCPDFLRYVGKPKTIVAVTGTNGKTTVSNMLNDILEAGGRRVLNNRAGSNIVCQNSTDAKPCSSTPVYATVTSPAATPTAATPPTAAGRMRSPSSSSTSENPPAQTSARTSA